MKNKEITIYELMGLIKDGKAPRRIEYNGKRYYYNFGDYYNTDSINLFNNDEIKAFSVKEIINLKIKILSEENDEWEDIEELYSKEGFIFTKDDYGYKINQLIKNQRKIIEKLENKDD